MTARLVGSTTRGIPSERLDDGVLVTQLGRTGSGSRVDWQAMFAAVFAGMGLTLLLVLVGSAAGLLAVDDAPPRLSSIVGAWAGVSAVLGTLAGSFVGGRFARWLNRGSVLYHAASSWGLSSVLSIVVSALVALALFGTAGGDGGDAGSAPRIGTVSWGLAMTMVGTLAASVLGWYAGSRARLLGFERHDTISVA